MTFKDKTFCASPNCTNKCGRKMTEEETKELQEINRKLRNEVLDIWINPEKNSGHIMMNNGVSYGYFCSEPEPDPDDGTIKIGFNFN